MAIAEDGQYSRRIPARRMPSRFGRRANRCSDEASASLAGALDFSREHSTSYSIGQSRRRLRTAAVNRRVIARWILPHCADRAMLLATDRQWQSRIGGVEIRRIDFAPDLPIPALPLRPLAGGVAEPPGGEAVGFEVEEDVVPVGEADDEREEVGLVAVFDHVVQDDRAIPSARGRRRAAGRGRGWARAARSRGC